jgi:hypothetical protein
MKAAFILAKTVVIRCLLSRLVFRWFNKTVGNLLFFESFMQIIQNIVLKESSTTPSHIQYLARLDRHER